ncbi:MAG: FHA domain-containing protein [Candidatus Methylumidiphilus sp.]
MTSIPPSRHESEPDCTMVSRTASIPSPPTGAVAHCLLVVEGSERGKNLEIGLLPVAVGRAGDNDLALADPFVSTHHCAVGFADGEIWVEDLGATNGGFLDGRRIVGKVVWPMAATLQVGKQMLRHEYRHRSALRESDELAKDLRRAAGYVWRACRRRPCA